MADEKAALTADGPPKGQLFGLSGESIARSSLRRFAIYEAAVRPGSESLVNCRGSIR